jgi:hypothetical protein
VVGTDGTVSGVPEAGTAWAAPGANSDGIQVEQCGYADTTDWTTGEGAKVVASTATLVHAIAARWSIPLRHLTNDELRAGQAGVVTHAQVSAVYRLSDHTDPGPNYPMTTLLGNSPSSPTTTEENTDMIPFIIKSPNRDYRLVTAAGWRTISNDESLRITLARVSPLRIHDKINDREHDVISSIFGKAPTA